MNSMRIASQRIIYAVAVFVMAVALVLPAIASAAQVTSRSIGLSSSSKGATNVTYTVKFTPVSNAGAFVIDFCDTLSTPLIGQSCVTPTGFSAAGADEGTAATGMTVASVAGTAGQVIVEGSLTASQAVTVNLEGINNPTAAATMFARIVTYDTLANAQTYQSEDLGSGSIDEGGVAIAITDSIGVSGVVLETLTFCVSGTTITASCAATTTPSVPLGDELTGSDLTVLSPGQLETGTIYTQVTTNAVNGVVVRLKSNAAGCGGLIRVGDAPGVCHILPALDDDIDAEGNDAKFGVKTLATSVGTADTDARGVLVPIGNYNDETYALNWASGDATGVTSTFGDEFLTTNNAPANNQNQTLTFGAMASNNTPAGTYKVDISLIAVGKF